jgi:GntR family transcriptional regulator
MSLRSFVPAYYQLAEDLKNKIESGELKPGDVIPSEAQLAAQYGVSRMTVRNGLSLLSKGGYINSFQGKGNFVASPKMDRMYFYFSENNLLGQNKKLDAKLLSVDVLAADDKTASKLQVAVGSKIVRIEQMLSSEDGPVAIDRRFLPYIKGAPLLEKEIEYAAFPESMSRHTELVSAHNGISVQACVLMKEEAKLLSSKVGFPALCIEQIIYSRDRKPLGWSKMICRGDRFVLKAVSEPYSERL